MMQIAAALEAGTGKRFKAKMTDVLDGAGDRV
jgi:hypothetical protein